MLCLNTQMHRWWNECRWGFKYLGLLEMGEEATLTLQFHWLPSTSPKKTGGKPWERPIDLQAGQGKEMVEEWNDQMKSPKEDGVGLVKAFNAATGRPLQTGHTFQIAMAKEDAYNMSEMVKLQWACLQLATMSGAAGDPEFLIDPDDEDEEEEDVHYPAKISSA